MESQRQLQVRDGQPGEGPAPAAGPRPLGGDPASPGGGNGRHAGPLRFLRAAEHRHRGGPLRPDMLVRLPGTKNMVVDAKAPLSAYLDAIEAKDDETRTARLQDHARQVRTTSAALGRKSYFDSSIRRRSSWSCFCPARCFSAPPWKGPGLDRDGRRAERHHRHADDADRAAAGGGLRLAAGAAGRECQGNQRPWQGALQAAGQHGRPPGQHGQQPGRCGRCLQQGGGFVGNQGVGDGPEVQGLGNDRR